MWEATRHIFCDERKPTANNEFEKKAYREPWRHRLTRPGASQEPCRLVKYRPTMTFKETIKETFKRKV